MIRIGTLLTALAVLAVPVLGAPAATAASHEEEVVLTVTGTTAAEGPVAYDRAALADLGSETVTTTTIWTEGPQVFTGVPLHILLDSLGVTEGTLLASAINDYTVEIPVTDAVPGGPIVAYALDGEPMSVRDKGPLWIIYPYDTNPEYQSEVIYARSIWQLDRIEVTE